MRDLTSTDASKAVRFLWTVTDKFVRFCVAHRNSHFLPIWQSANLHIACRQGDYRFQSAYNCIHIVHLIAYALGDRQSSCRPCRHNSFNQSVSFIVSHECADSPSVSVSLVTFDLMRNWTRKKKKEKNWHCLANLYVSRLSPSPVQSDWFRTYSPLNQHHN